MDDKIPSVTPNVEIFDIDMFSNQDTPTIATLHKLDKRVICYFNAGAYEPNRPDSNRFISAVLGSALEGWPDERWLDIRHPVVREIMTARIRLASQMDCDAIDPDNIDGYQNDNGLDLTAEHSVDYIRFLSCEAAKYNMAVGLKNALDIIPDVLPHVQFAVNEECVAYGECAKVGQFIAAGKPVFHIEYADARKSKRAAGSIASTTSTKTHSLRLDTRVRLHRHAEVIDIWQMEDEDMDARATSTAGQEAHRGIRGSPSTIATFGAKSKSPIMSTPMKMRRAALAAASCGLKPASVPCQPRHQGIAIAEPSATIRTRTPHEASKLTSDASLDTARTLSSESFTSCTSFNDVDGFSTIIKKVDLGTWAQYCSGEAPS